MWNWLKNAKGLKRYPTLLAGIAIIVIFVGVALYTVIAIPYSQVISLWRGGIGVWDDNPQNAAPVWFDWFNSQKLPRTIIVSGDEQVGGDTKLVQLMLPFQYTYDGFPDELKLFMEATYQGAPPAATFSWRTPDGRTILLQEDYSIKTSSVYYMSQDNDLRERLGGLLPQTGLFADPADESKPLKGDYTLELTAELPAASELNAKLVVYGKIYGLAGTDNRRRDLVIPLLWGAPIALVFGIAAAVGTSLVTFALSATGTWLGGKVDRTFQWLTQVNLIIPLLPVLIMVGYLYNRSIWVMLGLVIALNIFGSTMLTFRAMFLQAKEAPYIEAAQAYGARDSRIIFRYLIPRIAPTLLPEFVLIIPTFVFLEATLAVLGLGDPVLPTWGKVLDSAFVNGALIKGYYYWFLEPAVLLMLLGIGFSLIGYSLDRIFNPRLRTV